MLNKIIAWSLARRGLVLAIALAVAALGLVRGLQMPIDVLPDLNRPTVTVLTEAHGLVPVDVETSISRPIEQVMNGAAGVFRVRSTSSLGLSVVQIEFGWDRDVYRARQVVSEKLQLLREVLPRGVEPLMAPMSSIMGQVQLVGLRSSGGATDAGALRRLVERDVVPRLRAIAGIAQVVAMGGQASELQVLADAERLRAHGVTLEEVREAVRRAHVAVGGGVLPIGARAPVVAVPGRLQGPEQLALAVVRDDATRPVRLGDVAEVRLGAASVRVGDAGIDGAPGVVLVITKQPETDTVVLTEQVNAELARMRPELPPDVVVLDDLFQQAAFIHRAIDNVAAAVRDGGLLVVAVLFVFLLNLRTTLITLTAIPLSLALSAIVFAAFGLSINTMTLGGLAVAIGVLVDDAIVDVENVFRRLHENRERKAPVLEVVFRACSEVRKPVLYGTLLVTVVYLPLFFLTGIEGRLFTPIGIAYIVSVLASLAVALTVTPVLCYLLLGSTAATRPRYGGPLVQGLRALAAAAARFSLQRTAAVSGGVVALFLCGVAALSVRGSSFLPPFNEGTAQVNLMLAPDTGLDASAAMGQRLEQVLRTVPGVRTVVRRTGRAEGDEHVMPVSVSEVIVTFDPAQPRAREAILADIRGRVAEEFAGVASEVEQPLAHLLSHLLSGVTAQVALKIAGPDLEVLRRLAAEAESAVRPVPGVRDLYVEPQVLIDQVQVVPRREALARAGLTVADLAETVSLAFGGEEVTRVLLDQVSVPVRVLLEAADRKDVAQVGGLLLRRSGDDLVRVAEVAHVSVGKTPNSISRENAQRQIVVQHNVGGRALSEAVADVERALAPLRERLAALPGYSLRIAGQFAAQQQATRTIGWLSLVALGLMLALLFLHLRSWRLATLVLATRPLAFLGSIAFVLVGGQDLSVATLVGAIALLGMAARNAILLVDHSLHLLREEGEPLAPGLLVRAAQERVVPVLMTALTSGIGLLPLVLAADEPGRELLHPVATVVLGGLLTSTVLDFLVMPGLLWRAIAADHAAGAALDAGAPGPGPRAAVAAELSP